LDALPYIEAGIGNVLLTIAGDFWDDRGVYEQKINDLGLGKSVRIDDRYIPDEEVVLYFSAADLLVAPYISVTGSAVVQTGAGFGIPVVTTADFDPSTHHPASCRVAPNDPAELADAITNALRSVVFTPGLALSPAVDKEPGTGWQYLVEALLEFGN
jgi:D-inositol-3-phosphate glycosyltransferase